MFGRRAMVSMSIECSNNFMPMLVTVMAMGDGDTVDKSTPTPIATKTRYKADMVD
jgi:hypothetical protein